MICCHYGKDGRKRKSRKVKKKRNVTQRTDIPPVIQRPKRAGLGVAIGRHGRVVEADDGDARLQVRLALHAADVDDDGDGALGARAGGEAQLRREAPGLAAGRDLDADARVAAARRRHRLQRVVRVVPELVLLQQLQQLRLSAPVPLLGGLVQLSESVNANFGTAPELAAPSGKPGPNRMTSLETRQGALEAG